MSDPTTQEEMLRAEIARLKSETRVMRDATNGDLWFWQGDGEDRLESLVCPVVIHPSELQALISERPRASALLSLRASPYSMGAMLAALERRRIAEAGDDQDAPEWAREAKAAGAMTEAFGSTANAAGLNLIRFLGCTAGLIIAEIDRLLLRDGVPEDVGALVADADPLALALPAVVLVPLICDENVHNTSDGWLATVLGEEYRVLPPPADVVSRSGDQLTIELRTVVVHRSEQPEWQFIGMADTLDLARAFILGHALQRNATPAREG
jgi:hypothetical protein